MILLALVCPNGLGHFRRVVAVLARLLALRPDLRVTLACSESQARARPGKPCPDWDERVRTVTGVTEPGVAWSEQAGSYADGRLRGWEKRLDRLDAGSFDAVLSDNLSGVLACRPDAVLSGSFLWSEVLDDAFPSDPVVQDFVAWERGLLERASPPMLCVGALATPGVLRRTRAVDVGFTAYDDVAPVAVELPRNGPFRVAVLGGSTDAAAALHGRLVQGLLADPRWQVALPERELAAHPRAVPFGFSPADYRACAAVVARPGLGTVHEALAAGVPLVCSYESPQLEMAHVASRLAALGLARDFGSSGDAGALGALLGELTAPEARESFRKARAAVRMDGVQRAAEWLAERFAGARPS